MFRAPILRLSLGPLSASLLIQIPYWISTLKVFRLLSVPRHIFVGHAVMFLARLNFVFVGGLSRRSSLSAPQIWNLWHGGRRYSEAVLFSMFCFTIELERLGKLLLDG